MPGAWGQSPELAPRLVQFYPSATGATGLGWALAVGRLGAIAGPAYGAMLVGFGGGVPVAAMAFAAPALLGAALMLALRAKAARQAVPADSELVG